jgi:predicted NodU family carbamoyl transferase
VSIAQNISVFEPDPIPWSGWFKDEEKLKTFQFGQLSSALAPIFGNFPIAWKVHHQLKRLVSRERLVKIPEVLRNDFNITAPIKFYDHHYCHATSAYFTSNFQQALIVTLDGGGDGRSGSAYIGDYGQLREIGSVDSFNSLGNFTRILPNYAVFKLKNMKAR